MKKTHYFRRRIMVVVLLLLVSVPITQTIADEPSIRAGSDGPTQSPIDIRKADVTFMKKLTPLSFNYKSDVALDVENTGSPDEECTIRANAPEGAGALNVEGKTFYLKQFHWHSPGEHELDGSKFPMEMHLVHKDFDDNILVVAVWIKSGSKNSQLKKIFKRLPAGGGQHLPVLGFNLNALLPDHLESFRYTGSLTTKPYTEGVKFVVLAEPIKLSKSQISAFKALFPNGDAREAQPLNGRTIITDVEPDED